MVKDTKKFCPRAKREPSIKWNAVLHCEREKDSKDKATEFVINKVSARDECCVYGCIT